VTNGAAPYRFASCGLPSSRCPQGEYGVATVFMAAWQASCTSARLSFKVLTRRSSPVGVQAFDQRPEVLAQLRFERLDQPLQVVACSPSGR
jgi:hypothetical protein